MMSVEEDVQEKLPDFWYYSELNETTHARDGETGGDGFYGKDHDFWFEQIQFHLL